MIEYWILQFYDEGYERQWHYLLAQKYKHKRLDLVILAFLSSTIRIEIQQTLSKNAHDHLSSG